MGTDAARWPASPPPLSDDLRRRTAQAHGAAQQSPFMSALVEGHVTRAGLAALLGRLLPVYDALERAAATWTGHPVVGPFLLPGLERSDRLRCDLAHLGEPDGASSAALAYAARIADVAGGSAAAFVAHHYTRYLGDLSGGQVVRAALQRTLGAVDGRGASFFAFPGLVPGQARRHYRSLLDAAPFPDGQRGELVGEALEAYRMNVALVTELDHDLARWTTG